MGESRFAEANWIYIASVVSVHRVPCVADPTHLPAIIADALHSERAEDAVA